MARVLIVEDRRIVAKDIEKNLVKMQHEVVGNVASAEAALESAAARCPDLVLMDIHIKGQLDGIETAALLRARFQVPIVYLTAFADGETVARAKVTEPFGYIVKPYNPNELRSTVEIALYKHQIEMRLRESEESLATTLNSISDAVITTDAERRVRRMNPAAEALTGFRFGEVEGRLIEHVTHVRTGQSERGLDEPVEQALRGGVATHLPSDALLVAPDGSARPVAGSAAPLRDSKGKVRGAVVVLADASERRRLEAQVAEAGGLAAVGTLAAGVAHEINNPLAAVFLGLDLTSNWVRDATARLREARDRLGTTALTAWDDTLDAALSRLDAVRNLVADVQRSASRVRDVVRDLRTFSRTENPLALTRVALNAVLRSCVQLCLAEIRHRAQLVEDYGEVPLVEASESRLGQVFISLIVNAAHAIPEGEAARHRIRVTTRTDTAGRAVVEVSDTGAGIAPELRARVFDPFFTTKAMGAGTGLGLSISLGIVEDFKGSLTFDSEVGVGTTFRVVLPAAGSNVPATLPKAQRSEPPPRAQPRSRLLFIDDDDAIGRVVQLSLAERHDVVVVASARTALSLLRAGEHFDAVACDLMMPDVTGMDFYAELSGFDPGLAERVIFVTGGAFSARARAFLEAVPNLRLEKPFEPDELSAAVRSVVERHA